MSQPNVVSIGGIDYDSTTGEPVGSQPEAIQAELRRVQSVHANGVHRTQQRSTALNRRFVKKSAPIAQPAQPTAPARPRGGSMDVRPTLRSPHISRFARDPQALNAKRAVKDFGPVTHPSVLKARAAQQSRTQHIQNPAGPSARDIKHAAIGRALATATTEHKTVKKSRNKAFSVASASLGVLLIAGYFTYINMPNLSVRVAAAQAGIDATYPEYHPIGYRLNGPVAYQNGQVSMNFASNSGPMAFDLNQSRSSWDSSALLEKFVDPKSKGNYATYSDAGLTIYTFGNDAAWVNGGVLYTVDGTATLSNEQIRRIATSM